MKVPLRYQISEFDCGPTSLLNAVSYLFEQDEIPPDVIRRIMLYCLDGYGADGYDGRSGTTSLCMMFLSNWFNNYGQTCHLPIRSEFITGKQVCFTPEHPICQALRNGGVVVTRVFLDVPHYVLLTKVEGDRVYLFDPYYWEEPFEDPEVQMVDDHPFSYNRIVPFRVLNDFSEKDYCMGPFSCREALMLFNTNPENARKYSPLT